MSNLNLGLVGNGSYGALINQQGEVVWACMPRFDSDPVFCSLLMDTKEAKDRGMYTVDLLDYHRSEQYYLTNTAILITKLYDSRGGAIQITDFAPRFKQFGRTFRPVTLVRQIKPLTGNTRIRIQLRPAHDYGAARPTTTHGSNHIRYIAPDLVLRLTTDASVTAILDEIPFVLDDTITLVLGPDETLYESVTDVGREFFEKTHAYWREWVRYLGIPYEWQETVIRAAITLKLNAFEDTGAIIAAMTTSIPEAGNSGRNWDYRYCWIRDGHFVVSTLNRLGATKTLEGYLHYIINIALVSHNHQLRPVLRINGRSDLEEKIVETLPGYRGMGPVRIGNQAFQQIQNDVYGSAIVATTHVFFDQRMNRPGDAALFERLEPLGEIAVTVYDKPDSGLWELRNETRVHTFSSVMCWVACDQLAKIAKHLRLENRASYWRGHADTIHKVICENAWDSKQKTFVQNFGGEDLDASLLLLNEFGFLAADDPRFAGTVSAIERQLRRGNLLLRYAGEDDFGKPENAFTACTFWYINALAVLGRKDEARSLFENMLACRNHLGLLSEDIDPTTGELWGNFPQTYSMVGLIDSAMRLSKPWREAF